MGIQTDRPDRVRSSAIAGSMTNVGSRRLGDDSPEREARLLSQVSPLLGASEDEAIPRLGFLIRPLLEEQEGVADRDEASPASPASLGDEAAKPAGLAASPAQASPAKPPRPSKPPRDPAEPIGLIAIDVDGTLLRTDKRLPKRVAHAIQKAAAAGVRVVLASARPPRSVRAIYEYLGLDTPTIHYNGALIRDIRAGLTLFHQPLPAHLVRQIIAMARRIDPRVIVSIESLDHWYTDRPDHSLQTATSRRFDPDHVGPFPGFLHQPVTKLMLLAPAQRMERIGMGVSRRFGDHVTIAVSDRDLLQIIHPSVDKSAALALIAQRMGVPPTQVMAIGDAPNDIGMLRWAGLGVAVENAWDRVRDAADVIVPSNDHNGVAVAIEQFALRTPPATPVAVLLGSLAPAAPEPA
jgi:Cof subfamily protein (haloacid dehalogenase superfamily)